MYPLTIPPPGRHQPQKESAFQAKKKPCWNDPVTGRHFSAGGILLYDTQGLYLVGETSNSGVVYSDIGGRYIPEDGNIWATIRRELYEETYGVCDLLTKEVIQFSKHLPLIVLDSVGSILKGTLIESSTSVIPQSSYSYMCLAVPICSIPEGRFDFDDDLYQECRARTIAESSAPESFYRPVCIKKVLYDDLGGYNLSHRLKAILSVFVPPLCASTPHSHTTTHPKGDEKFRSRVFR